MEYFTWTELASILIIINHTPTHPTQLTQEAAIDNILLVDGWWMVWRVAGGGEW